MPTDQREIIPSISSRDTTSTKRVVMSVASQKDWTAPVSWDEVKRSWMNFAKDLKAFASLQIAWFIVWRALRQGRRETTEQPQVSERVSDNSAWAGDGKYPTPTSATQSMRGRSLVQ